MNHTRGKWITLESNFNDTWRIVGEFSWQVCEYIKTKDDANLITTAVNACQDVNPINPLAVAESIKAWHEALKAIAEGKGAYSMDRMTHAENTIRDMVALAKEALAKVEGDEG